jgi:hypothetical protein
LSLLAAAFFPARQSFLERRLVHIPSPPGKLVREGIFLLLREKKEEKIKDMESWRFINAYRGSRAAQYVR